MRIDFLQRNFLCLRQLDEYRFFFIVVLLIIVVVVAFVLCLFYRVCLQRLPRPQPFGSPLEWAQVLWQRLPRRRNLSDGFSFCGWP